MMFELVEELNRKGMTILLVEQNIFQALKISHYTYVIKTGKIVLEGLVKNFFQTRKYKTPIWGPWSKYVCLIT